MSNATIVPRRWVLLSSMGIAVGIPAGLALGAPLEVLVGAMVVTPVMLGLAGLFLGTSQWLALRGTVEHARRWIVLTALGFSAGFTLAIVGVEQGGALLTGAPVRMATSGTLGLLFSVSIIGVVGGGVLGIVQAHALREFDGARLLWALASALGLTTGLAAGAIASTAVGGVSTASGLVVFLGVTGVVYAAATGHALRSLPRPA